MAIPSGSGTEVLKRVTVHGNNSNWVELLSGTANHIYTIISIIFCDQHGAAGTISMRINDGTNDIMILSGQSYPSTGTFVFNDKLVLEGDDDIDVYNSTNNGDWYMSYIDQDWT